MIAVVGVLTLYRDNEALLEKHSIQLKAVRVTTMAEGYGGSDELPFPSGGEHMLYKVELPEPDSFDRLRRLAAHILESGALPDPRIDEPMSDPVLRRCLQKCGLPKPKLFERRQTLLARSFVNLACHNGSNGYYSPREFDGVLEPAVELGVEGGVVGSAPKLAEECERIANQIGLPLGSIDEARSSDAWSRYPFECEALIALYRGGKHSFETQRCLALIEPDTIFS